MTEKDLEEIKVAFSNKFNRWEMGLLAERHVPKLLEEIEKTRELLKSLLGMDTIEYMRLLINKALGILCVVEVKGPVTLAKFDTEIKATKQDIPITVDGKIVSGYIPISTGFISFTSTSDKTKFADANNSSEEK